jgi:hypothetical protein
LFAGSQPVAYIQSLVDVGDEVGTIEGIELINTGNEDELGF